MKPRKPKPVWCIVNNSGWVQGSDHDRKMAKQETEDGLQFDDACRMIRYVPVLPIKRKKKKDRRTGTYSKYRMN